MLFTDVFHLIEHSSLGGGDGEREAARGGGGGDPDSFRKEIVGRLRFGRVGVHPDFTSEENRAPKPACIPSGRSRIRRVGRRTRRCKRFDARSGEAHEGLSGRVREQRKRRGEDAPLGGSSLPTRARETHTEPTGFCLRTTCPFPASRDRCSSSRAACTLLWRVGRRRGHSRKRPSRPP